MRLLITNTTLAYRTGSEVYVRDLALALQRRGHEVVIYSPMVGALAETLRLVGIPVLEDLDLVQGAPDLIHGQHHLETMAALARFPGVPAVYCCHGWMPWEELPPHHPRILRYLCVSERLQDRLTRMHGVPPWRVRRVLNAVDLHRFQPRSALPGLPRRALALSNQITRGKAGWMLRSACAHHGIHLQVVGLARGNPSMYPELLLPQFELVFARGRAALEALAVGAAVICCDVEGLGPMVDSANFSALRQANFGVQILEQPLTERALRREIRKYDASDAGRVSEMTRHTADLEAAVDQILEVYLEALDEWGESPRQEGPGELQALGHHLKFLSETYRRPFHHLTREEAALHTGVDRGKGLRRWLTSGKVRGLLAFHGLKRWVSRQPPTPVATPEPWQEPDPEHPSLACVVLSFGNQPTLVPAVKSLVDQGMPVEIVVVNSGGGDPAPALEAAGLRVKVVNHGGRLLPGAARNVGLLATSAPYVAFLAADCLAEAGWVEARLRRHRGGGAAAVSSAMTNALPDNLWSQASHLLLFSRRMPGVPPGRVLHYGVSYDRRLFQRYGLFREDLRTGEDSEFNDRFAPLLPLAWVPEVRTAHVHPSTLPDLLRDQFRRGGRMVTTLKLLMGRSRRAMVARNSLVRTLGSLKLAWRAQERNRLLAVACVMPLAAAAYALGALLTRREKGMAPRKERPRVLALLTFHNEMRYLPDYFRNVSPQVDGIIALDDGSTDGSGEFVAGQPSVLQLLRLPARNPHVWDEPRNRRLLVQAALDHGADWVMVVDSDERLERDFHARALAEIARGEQEGWFAFSVDCRELWDQGDTYREDGVWGRKAPVRLFKARRDHLFDDRPLHGHWAPLNSRVQGGYPHADLIFYHLAMLSPEDRRARQAKYFRLDPDRQHQAIGYEYMTDETGLRLSKLLPGREFLPMVGTSPGVGFMNPPA